MNFIVNKFSIYHARDYYVVGFCTYCKWCGRGVCQTLL